MFQKAKQEEIKIRMALYGPSGSGKTYSALNMAQFLGQSIAVIDTEHGSSNRYARYFNFDVCRLDDPELVDYIKAIEAAERAGYDTVVIDSMSHAWYRELEMAGGNFNNWKNVRPLERKLIEAILGSKCHCIVTMRSKTEYVKQENAKGKTEMVKVGTAAIQAQGIEYEFDIVGVLTLEHIMNIEKSRCVELTGKDFLNPGQKVAEIMLAWANGQDVESLIFNSASQSQSKNNQPKGNPKIATTVSKTIQTSAPKPPKIWDTWRNSTDRNTWALSILPDADPEFLSRFFSGLKASNKDEKGALIVQSVMDFKEFGGYEKINAKSEQPESESVSVEPEKTDVESVKSESDESQESQTEIKNPEEAYSDF